MRWYIAAESGCASLHAHKTGYTVFIPATTATMSTYTTRYGPSKSATPLDALDAAKMPVAVHFCFDGGSVRSRRISGEFWSENVLLREISNVVRPSTRMYAQVRNVRFGTLWYASLGCRW